MYHESELHAFFSVEQVLKLLRKNPAFSKYCYQRTLKKGETIQLTPLTRGSFYMVEKGSFSVYYESRLTGRMLISFFQHDDIFNFPLLKERMHPILDFIALTDAQVWVVDFNFMLSTVKLEDPRNYLQLNFLSTVQIHLGNALIRKSLDSKKRILHALVELSEKMALLSPNQAYELPTFMTYELLAEIAGTSRGYTSRILKELRDMDVIDSSKRPWIVKDLNLLNNLLYEGT
ncbi:Crp/Fnr family transcriptional regulator [Listeria rustica]|uniref:Crp/Fnr family transcriptional regulator n=1 Tax=Listeria rustica TaxID=2713503 RepID=A0A7W1T9I3_9LIST|nr:Crp/Fnr family transcriptional regulator [Listeria rustica]MBA3927920.1 Crp/Fnr family transcriptional regulator [Listeria rustica]